VGSTTIEPGGESFVDFVLPMGMHQGMEGRHLFRITVPVQTATGGAAELKLYVRANFR
jgi:hypothetical protein